MRIMVVIYISMEFVECEKVEKMQKEEVWSVPACLPASACLPDTCRMSLPACLPACLAEVVVGSSIHLLVLNKSSSF
jgi:hypothetical protein